MITFFTNWHLYGASKVDAMWIGAALVAFGIALIVAYGYGLNAYRNPAADRIANRILIGGVMAALVIASPAFISW